jgi:hypothetical protein
MGSCDRDYNRYSGGNDYFGNPASILSLSIPFGTWFGVRVRLHFWLLLSFVITFMALTHRVSLQVVVISIISTLLAVLCHDFGHRIFAHWVGGRHDEFMLWPAGGMIFPSLPPGAWALFVGSVGGMAINIVLALGCFAGAYFMAERMNLLINPLSALGADPTSGLSPAQSLLAQTIIIFGMCNWGVVMINLLPYYWFDGGFLLQSFLWPFLGTFGAINITCIIGMLLAAPMFFVYLSWGSLMGMVFWALLFSSAYSKRKQIHAEGTGELEGSIAWSAQNVGESRVKPKRRWMQPNYAKRAAAAAAKARKEQDSIDAILAKVSVSGMNSLTRGERKTLEQATERQRNR